jgi:murein peptide amidase A
MIEKYIKIIKITTTTLVIILFIPIAIFIFSIMNLWLNSRDSFQIQLGQDLCINSLYPIPSRIRTDSAYWHIEKIENNKLTQIENVLSNNLCLKQVAVTEDFDSPEEVSIYFRIIGEFEIKLGNIKIDQETFTPKYSIETKNGSIKLEVENISEYLTYSLNFNETDSPCVVESKRASCTIKVDTSLNNHYKTNKLILNSSNEELKFPKMLSSLIIELPDNSLEIAYRSDNPEIFCEGNNTCVLGSTVNGEPIAARIFGKGENRLFIFGAMHGSEKNSAEIVQQLILAINSGRITIPEDKQLIIIPTLNIDGYKRNNRLNANSVDINRNYPTKDWVADTFLTDEQTFKNGGGTIPVSEPETRLTTYLIETVNPYLSVSYHSWGKYSIPNSLPEALLIGQKYAELSKYVYSDPFEENTGFNYVATGTINTWGNETGYNIITIELADLVNHDFENNKDAIQMLINWE